MASVPIFPIAEVAPYAWGAIDLAKSCREHAQELFAILDPASPVPREKILTDVCEGEKFDSATMIFLKEWNAQWTSGPAILRAEALEDEFCNPTRIVLKISLKNAAAGFQLECSDVIGIRYSTGEPAKYVLNMRRASVRSANLSPKQLGKLGKLLRFPPALADGSAALEA